MSSDLVHRLSIIDNVVSETCDGVSIFAEAATELEALHREVAALEAQLAERESEAVGHIERRPIPDGIVPPGIIYTARLYDGSLPNGTMLYTTPQPPAVPDGYILIPEAPLKELIKKTGPLTLTDLSYTKFWQEVEQAVLNSKTMLAERESEAVGRVDLDGTGTVVGFLTNGNFKVGDKLYTTPQPPAVPDRIDMAMVRTKRGIDYAKGWNAYREAMLAASGEGE